MHGRWGVVARAFTPGPKFSLQGIPHPELIAKLITCRYSEKPPKNFIPAHLWDTYYTWFEPHIFSNIILIFFTE